jgi:hypothetical protein
VLLRRYFDDQDGHTVERMLLDSDGQRRARSSRDEGSEFVEIRRLVVARTSAGDGAVVLNAYKQPTWFNGGAIGEADHCLDEFPVVEDRSLLALEFDIQCLTARATPS